jgi:antitoxin MazE
MSDNSLERVEAILKKWERNDLISHVRTNRSGHSTIEILAAIQQNMHIETGATVEWKQMDDGSLNITIEPPVKYSLADLVAGITPENCHEYIDTGHPNGKEKSQQPSRFSSCN